MLPRISATAYLTPLREGGSLPGLMEADDLGTYVVKFTGAGQGPKALVAEIVVGELGRALGSASVTAEVLAETKGPKIRIFKYKNKTGYRKRQGHRQRYTQVKVTGIES